MSQADVLSILSSGPQTAREIATRLKAPPNMVYTWLSALRKGGRARPIGKRKQIGLGADAYVWAAV